MADPRVEAVAEALRAEGADTNIHGWRCEYPDRYGPCDCVQETAEEVVSALDAYEREHESALDAPCPHRGDAAVSCSEVNGTTVRRALGEAS